MYTYGGFRDHQASQPAQPGQPASQTDQPKPQKMARARGFWPPKVTFKCILVTKNVKNGTFRKKPSLDPRKFVIFVKIGIFVKIPA